MDPITFLLTLAFTTGALVGIGYTWRGLAEARDDLAALVAEGDVDEVDRLLALRNVRAKQRRLGQWLFLFGLGCLAFLTPARADPGTAVVVLGVELPARILRAATSLAFIVWEWSMVVDDRDDNATRARLTRSVVDERQRKELAKATGGRVGGLRETDGARKAEPPPRTKPRPDQDPSSHLNPPPAGPAGPVTP